jgi:hypothetical protein
MTTKREIKGERGQHKKMSGAKREERTLIMSTHEG